MKSKERSWIMWLLYSLDSKDSYCFRTKSEAKNEKKDYELYMGERFRIKKVNVREVVEK